MSDYDRGRNDGVNWLLGRMRMFAEQEPPVITTLRHEGGYDQPTTLDPTASVAITDYIDRLAAENAELREGRDRLREALGQIIDCDHHNHSDGPAPRYVQIARAARALSKGER